MLKKKKKLLGRNPMVSGNQNFDQMTRFKTIGGLHDG